MIAHIVLFEPKPDVTQDDRRQFVETIRAAVRAVGEVQRAHIGRISEIVQMPNRSGQSTYSYGAVFEFRDAEGLKAYLQHPAHIPLREAFWRFCAETMIADVDMVDAGSEANELLV